MIIDSHEHVMLPTTMQIEKLNEAGVDKAILFTTTPHVEKAKSSTLKDINSEMQALYRLLSGGYTPQERMEKMKDTIAELQQADVYKRQIYVSILVVLLCTSRNDCDSLSFVQSKRTTGR